MKHRSTYENIRAAVQDLTLCEKYILYYLAFADNASKYSLQDIGRDCRNIRITEINLSVKNLLNNGFIKNRSPHYYSEKYSLDGLSRLELAMNLFRFESIGVRTDIGGIRYQWGLDLNHTTLWKCAELLSKNDTFGLKDLFRKYPSELSFIVINLAYNMGMARVRGSGPSMMYAPRYFDKALEMMEPDTTMMYKIYSGRALAYYKRMEFSKAIPDYVKAYSYNPSYISALTTVAYCYEQLKDYAKAKEYYERYLKVGKEGTEGYNFATKGLEYVKGQLFMEEKE